MKLELTCFSVTYFLMRKILKGGNEVLVFLLKLTNGII